MSPSPVPLGKVRSRNTKLELNFRRALWAGGVRGWRCHDRSVFGNPDLVWKRLRIAVFLDSAWWHGHPSRWKAGHLPEWWDNKIRTNKRRDLAVNKRLRAEGWTVVRIWDFELEREHDRHVSALKRLVDHKRRLVNRVKNEIVR